MYVTNRADRGAVQQTSDHRIEIFSRHWATLPVLGSLSYPMRAARACGTTIDLERSLYRFDICYIA
jgi:hypothetical protein